MRFPWQGPGEMFLFLRLAEIRPAEKFGRQNNISAAPGSLFNEAGDAVDIVLTSSDGENWMAASVMERVMGGIRWGAAG